MDWRDIYVFISSTFNDMHAERDFLVKEVFPELTEWCEKRKLRLIEIDLRWGITAADSETKNTVKACLENIDRCRPFFLCFLGQRRGWIPNDPLRYEYRKKKEELTQEQIEKEKLNEISESSYTKYKDLEKFDGKASVTEMEIEHALLSPMLGLKPSDRALFFFRKHEFDRDNLTDRQRMIYLNDELKKYGADPKIADHELEKFKDKVRSRWKNVTAYTCKWVPTIETPELFAEDNGKEIAQGRLVDFKANGTGLKEIILAQLETEILKEVPDREEIPTAMDTSGKTPFELAFQNDLEQQQLFIRLHSEGYIPRDGITGKLDEYINDDSNNRIFLLAAKAGLGKTMLLANYVNRLTEKQEENRVVHARFCGASDLSSGQYSLWKSLFYEAGMKEIGTFDELRQNMPKLLEELSQKGKAVIVMDAINQIQGGLEMLSWLSGKLPEGLKMIVSIKEDGQSEKIIQNLVLGTQNTCFLPPFKEKRKLVHKFLERYFKALDDNHIETVCNLPYADNPLFLKILLHELRMYGAFGQLETEIARYGNNPEEAFNALLKRLEADPAYGVIVPGETVPYLFGLLSHARSGLSEEELTVCFRQKFPGEKDEKIKASIRFYLRQVRPFMARRDGRADFLYESFKLAAKTRYKNGTVNLQKALSECFLKFCDSGRNGLFETRSPRALTEYAHHLGKYNIPDAERLYCNIPYLNTRCSICPVGELLMEYSTFTQPDIKQYYNVIFRHAETLSQYGNALFSILYYSGFEHAKQQIDGLLSSYKWNKPWICTKLLYQMEEVCENNKNLSFHTLATNKLHSTVAVQTVKNKNLAFYSEGNGRIRSVDTITFALHETLIRTLPVRPVNIAASDDGAWLAVGYEDSTVEIIRLLFNEKNIPYLSESTKRLSYLLPMYDNGVFGFNGNFFWYQKDETTLVKTDISGEKNDEEINLEHPGEMSSILFVQKNAVLSIRQSDRTVLILLCIDNQEILATRYIENADIVTSIPVNGDNMAVSTTDNRMLIFNARLDRQTSIHLDMPVIAAVALETQLFLILKDSGKKLQYVLWDFTTDAKTGIPFDDPVSYASQISVKENEDNSLFIISDNVMCKFILSEENAVLHKSEIIAVDYPAKQDAVTASGLLIATEENENITIIHNDIAKELPGTFDAQRCKALFTCNGVYAFDFGEGYALSLADMELTPVNLKSHLNVACVGKDNYLYYYDIARNLRCLQSDFRMDLSIYNFISASLYSLDDYILLAGSADDAESGIRKERGYESAPFMALFFEIVPDGYLNFIGKRRFLSSKGNFLSIAKNREDRFYIAFCTPNTGKMKEPPIVCYGTIDDFLNQREKEKVLHCSKENFSMACAGNSLLTCSNGKIIGYDIHSLEYQATVAAEKPFRFINPVKGFPSCVLAVCGKNEIMQISIHQ